MTRRVVVTGLGMLTALAPSAQGTFNKLIASQSGIGTTDGYIAETIPIKVGGMIEEFNNTSMSAKDARKVDPFIQFGVQAAQEAIYDSKIHVGTDLDRIGATIGTGVGAYGTNDITFKKALKNGFTKVSPFYIPGSTISMTSSIVCMNFGFTGPCFANSSACSAGAYNIALAARLIQQGDVDAMVCGGSEAVKTSLGFSGLHGMKALSTNPDPETASRPFDRDRDGFVPAEGAGVVVLEDYDHAIARGAYIYAELTGIGMSCDAYHMSAPAPDGRGAKLCMSKALADAKLQNSDIGYINAHGTSTKIGDEIESQAIESIFGKHVPVSSTKSALGHLVGAAGAVEAIISIQALESGILPPTLNLDNPDEKCTLDNYVAHEAQLHDGVNHVMSNSFGFGGTNCSLIFSEVEDV